MINRNPFVLIGVIAEKQSLVKAQERPIIRCPQCGQVGRYINSHLLFCIEDLHYFDKKGNVLTPDPEGEIKPVIKKGVLTNV